MDEPLQGNEDLQKSEGQPHEGPCPEGDRPALPSGLSYGWAEPDLEEDAEDLWLRFEAGEMLAMRVLSPIPLQYWGHWYPAVRAYRLCQAKRDRAGRILLTSGCAFCPRPAVELPGGKPIASPGRRRQILTVELQDGRQRLWEFSETVSRQMRGLAGEGDWVGVCLLLRRAPPKPNGAVIVALDEDPEPRGALPEPIDAAALVLESWRRAALRDGKAGPNRPFG